MTARVHVYGEGGKTRRIIILGDMPLVEILIRELRSATEMHDLEARSLLYTYRYIEALGTDQLREHVESENRWPRDVGDNLLIARWESLSEELPPELRVEILAAGYEWQGLIADANAKWDWEFQRQIVDASGRWNGIPGAYAAMLEGIVKAVDICGPTFTKLAARCEAWWRIHRRENKTPKIKNRRPKAPPCPICKGPAKTTSTRPTIRSFKCKKCGHTWRQFRSD